MKNFVKCGILLLMILLSVCVFTACECEHEFQETVIKEATCGQEGQKELVCAKCDKVQTEAIPATGDHRYTVAITKMATCAAEGTKTKTCRVCNDVVTETIPKTTNHSYSSKITKEATCIEEGSKTKTCNICKDVKTEVIPKSSSLHNYTEEITQQATCTKDGIKKKTCSICQDVTEVTIRAAHSFGEWTTTKKATCVKNGKEERKCTSCKEKQSREIEARGYHSFDMAICQDCGEGYYNITLPKLRDIKIGSKYFTDYSYRITSVRYEVETDYGTTSLYVYFSGQKNYDSEGYRSNRECYILVKLYDSQGFVIDSATAYSPAIKEGDMFKDARAWFYDIELDPDKKYYIRLFDYES